MSYLSDDFWDLYTALESCINNDTASQLNIYGQLESLYQYFNNCVFSDDSLEEGKTYILPMDVEIDMFEQEEYNYFTDPDDEEYDPDLAPFVESHNMHIDSDMVCITLKAGTQFTFSGSFKQGPYGLELIVDGYSLEWYNIFIGADRYGNKGAVPFVVKA